MNTKIKKGLKYTGISLLVLIGLILIAPQLFKNSIESAVKDATAEFVTTPVNFTKLNVSFFNNSPNLQNCFQQF